MAVLEIVGAVLLAGSMTANAQSAPAAGDTPDPIKQLQAAAAATPNDPESHFRLGDALEKTGDLAGAESEYKKSLALQVKNPSALGALAYLYSTEKRFADAETTLRSFIALQPQDAKAHVQLGRVLFSSGKNDEAAKELTAALGLAPADPSILMQVAQLFSANAMYAQAEPHFAALT